MKKRDFKTYQKRFPDFEIVPKFSETHVFRGTIRQLENENCYATPFRSLILRKKTTVLQSKRKPEKKSGFYGIRSLDLCDTDAVLYQLS